ncbi:response regulator transcription factor [Silvibacterium dinghuense]|nr:response regulator transcription factor [Silvibacterium dinghuense]
MSGPAALIRVLIVDDHPVVRFGLRTMLESESRISVTGMVGSAREAVRALTETPADVVLMDLRMPELEGSEAILELKRTQPDARILVLTNYESEEDILGALRAGATGYLLKNTPQDEIVRGIEMVFENRRYVPPSIADRLMETLGREELTPRELEVLMLVARGMTNKEIAQALFISDKTARNHVTNCLLKLKANDRTEAVTTAIRRGIIRISE